MKSQRNRDGASSTATLGFESQLGAAANALRGSMDAAEYKHVVLGLISLKYISDVFEEHYGYFLATMDGGMKHAYS
jgi:type I restriction enzyme M protein